MQRKILATASALAVLLALGACGGGGSEIGGGQVVTPGKTIEITDGPATKINAKGGSVFRLSATAASYTTNLAEMKWSVVAVTPGAPAMVLTDANCASAVRNDMSGAAGFSSSTWVCQISTVAPALAKEATYQLSVTGKDAKGAAATHSSEIVVTAVPAAEIAALRPTVATASAVNVRGGENAGLTCSGTPGSSAVSSALTYSWRVKSNPDGLALTLTGADKSTVTFAAPAVATGAPKRATFECTVTDANGHSASTDVAVTIASDADSASLPTVVGSSTTAQLYTGVESQLSCTGSGGYIANEGDGLRYRWVVKSNSAGVVLDMVGSDQSTVRIKPASLPPSVVGNSAPVTLQCRVTDDANRTVTVDVTATVNRYEGTTATNTVVANAGTSKVVQIGEIVVLDGGQSKMVGVTGAQLYYSWKQVSGPVVLLSGANTVNASFKSPNAATVAALRFELTVAATPITAAYVPKVTEVAYVDVSVASAAAPRITLPAVAEVGGGVSHSLTATVTDNPEGRPLYFRWTQVAGTDVTIQTPNLSSISFFTPVVPGAFEDLVFNVEASFDPAFPSGSTASQDAIVRITGTGN